MNTHLEKKIKKYVIAKVETPISYLTSLHQGKYVFTDNIEYATKFLNRSTAMSMIQFYYFDTGIKSNDMVVIPLMISYELVNES